MTKPTQTPDTAAPWASPIRMPGLQTGKPTGFSLEPDAPTRAAIASELGLLGLKKLRFAGTLTPLGKSDWQLSARLGASVVQGCVVTLAPVNARIEEDCQRLYLARMPESEPTAELEIPQDDSPELLGEFIDPGLIMVEALALALPQFPRAPGASLPSHSVTEPGKTPMSDADASPFAALRDKLQEPPADSDN